uniref:nesprin-2 n=1 Tax=Epinephelus lanceolatus TaxID=310571 RepID=UPI001448468C|nr:nesprin-2 [Epinephelus lanceolatus]
MSSDFYYRDDVVERGSIPLDIDNVHMLLQVEQEQIQKKTFTNWVNAQLAKRRPPCMVVDLFHDFRDGSKLLDLLEVMSGQRLSRERGRGMFQHRSNIEKALSFLKKKSIKLVNINIPDIIDGKPSIILGLIWTIILQYHIEELASGLSFDSRQSSMESLASLDSRSTLSSRSAGSSPVPPRGSPLHNRFRVSAKKALLLWVREQCHKAGCSINVKDFKTSWRSGVAFLAIQYALRPDLVDLSKARTRSNKQNLEEAFSIAERELRIPRLLDPDDVDVRDPDEKSIMTYVAQFLQYSKDLPVTEEEMQTQYLTVPKSPSPVDLPVHYTPAISASPLRQATPVQKAQEVTCWLVQAYDELLEGWDSTEGESYSERYHVIQTFLVSFNEQRRPIMPLLTAMRRTPKLSDEQRALRDAWDNLTEKLREYKVELDKSLPAPLNTVARWLLKTENALAEEEGDPQDHGRAADDAREKQELLKVCLEDMPQHVKTFQSFQNLDEYGNVMVPTDKMDELKRRFTSVRVTAKYHGIKLDYREHRHTVLDLLGQIRTKLRLWKRPYISPEAVRVLLQEWHDLVNTQELPSLLESALHKLKQVSEKYSSKSALTADYHQVSQQVKQLEGDTTAVLEEVTKTKSTMGRVLSAWDSYSDCFSSLQAWLEQGSAAHSHGQRPEMTSEMMAEWGSRQAHLNEVGNFLIESTDPQTSRGLAEELRRLNMHWAEFVKKNTFDNTAEPSADVQARPQDIQALIREATLILREPLQAMGGPLRTYRKRIQFIMRKIKELDLEGLASSPECPADQLQKLKLAVPEVMQTLMEAEQVCTELQHSVSGLDSRMAELLHWETEASELYQLLRAQDRQQQQQQRGQDPRARALISRGLQLEGQVVTEEQDLQVMVMTGQKNSPIQYLHATAMQDRVRAAVAQSQEVVGMLSSLGARRDRSRSPPEGSPPSKVFKQAKESSQYLTQSDRDRWPTKQPETTLVSHQRQTFVPKIVLQEYRQEKVTSPTMPYTYAQAVMQTRTKSPPEGYAQAWPEAAVQKPQQTQEQGLIQQQQPPQQGQLDRQTEKELQQQELKQQQPQEVQQQGPMQTQPQQLQQKQEWQQVEQQQQQVEMHQFQVKQVVTERPTPEPHEQTSLQQPPVKKPHLSSQELQSRKTQAMKNRPWLQKPGSGEHKTPTPEPEQDSTQEIQLQSTRETVASVQVVTQHTASTRPQPEAQAKVTKQPEEQQKEQQKQAQQPQNLEQQQQLQHQQKQQKEKHQQQKPHQLEKQQRQQEQLLLQQQQEKQPPPIVRQAQPDSDTKAKSQTATMAQPHPQTKAPSQSQPQTTAQAKTQAAAHVPVQSASMSLTSTDRQQPLKTTPQTTVSQGQPQTQVLPQPYGPVKTQSVTQQQTQQQLQPQVQTQSQTCASGGPQPSVQPQGLLLGPPVVQVQTFSQVKPSSPMQASFQGQIPPPVPSHIQLRSHPQSWSPVRPPSPKPPTQAQMTQPQTHAQSVPQPQTHPQSMSQPQTHTQSTTQVQTRPQYMTQPQTHPQSMIQPQTHPQSMTQSQIHPKSMAQVQTHAQPTAQPSHTQPSAQQTQAPHVVRPQGPIQPMTQYPAHAQPEVQHPGHISQGQIHAWTQVRGSSPMSVQYPQAPAQHPLYPQGYSQGQSPTHQWPPKQEPQTQPAAQQRHPVPQSYPQQRGQAPQSQAYPAVQAQQQWPQVGPQQGPQVGYSHMGPSYTQPQMQTQSQPWAQTQPQMRPQSSMQHQPQMGVYNMFHMQGQQGQVQQQTWVQAPPQRQPQPYPQPYPQPQSQKYSQVQHQPQRHPQPQMQAQTPPQSQPPHPAHPQLPSQPQIQPQQQVQSQTHIQTLPLVQVKPQAQTQQPQPSLQFQQQPPQPKHQVQLQQQPKIQSPTQPKGESPPQPKRLAQSLLQSEVQSPTQPKVQSQTQLKVQSKTQPKGQPQTQTKVQSPTQPKAESVAQTLPEPQLLPQLMAQSTVKAESPPQPKPQAQTAPLPEAQSQTQPKVQSSTQPKTQSPPQPKSQAQAVPLPEAQPPTQPKAQSPPQPKPQSQTAPLPEAQLPAQPKVQSPTQPKAQTLPQPQLQAQSPPLPKAQTGPQSKAQSPPHARPQTQPPPQSKPQTQSPPQPKPQQPQTVLLPQVNVLPQSLSESPELCMKPPALAQAPPQAYTEAYAKAQALARNGFEEAKHCLQEHIMECINVFKDKSLSSEPASVKEETLKTLDPELLEEFLRAAKGMEAFCTPSQLRDMEFFTQSVMTQWEACFSAEGSFAQAGQHLEALKELCDTLSPEDAHRLAQTQLRECETRLAAIQRQFSGDQDAPLPDSRIPVAFSEDLTAQKEPTRPSDKPLVSAEVLPVKTAGVAKREVEKHPSVDDEVTKKEALERYENCKRALQAQLAKNEQSIEDVPSDSVSLKGLHTRLQEIQFLRQETESLWSEYANQCSQCSQLSGNTGLEQEKAELQEQWRSQQSKLQKRGSSLGAALRQIDSTENHMVDFTDRLDRYLRQPKDVTAFTLANTNILKDIKELDDNIQSELDQLSRLDPESSDLDPRDSCPLSREVETHKASLDQLRQQVRKSEAAARALDRFLMSLRTVDEDISGVQGAPCSDPVVLQDCRSKLGLIRQSIDSLKEKAPQLDVLLQGARLTVTREGVPASCLDMVTALLRRLEEADSGLAGQQKGLQKETQSKSLGLRKRTLLGELSKLQETIETQGLKEPTIPAVQNRLRALSDLDGQVQAQHAELKNLRELQEKQGGEEHVLQEVETQWKEIQRAFSDRNKQCSVLLELLKKFQSCRSQLSSTMQKAEQTISERASYLGKENLQRTITTVRDIKKELGGIGEGVEEMKGVCRQLQTQLKKFPDCSEVPFEGEANTLMDNWLDVTEKTDTYMDNLQVGLELWEKQLMLGGEVDGWAGAKLVLFAESHPFHNEQQVLAMRDEIHANEENIEHFHKKSVEIQEMLQSREAPLELQVMETQLRKRMEQVKELFADCTDVFEELVAVKKHLTEKIEECQCAVEGIQCSVNSVDASQPTVEDELQNLCDDLETQEEQAEAALKEVGLISSVASPQVLEALSADCDRLKEAISRTKEMIHLKREERDKGLLKVIKDEKQSFEEWFQDLQLSVNECFEQPESRADVETSLQKLTAFLKSRDAERRLEQLKDQLERGSKQVPPQQLSEFKDWLKEQEKEVGRFRTHCDNKQKQMEPLLSDLNSLQMQHDSFREWLQTKEKQSAKTVNAKLLLTDLQDESGRVESLKKLLASLRKQGVRGESLLKDGDNLIQRYSNLEARLQKQADAQSALEGEFDKFNTQTESTRTWITDLVKPLTSTGRDTQTEEIKQKAQAVLSSKPEGDSKVSNLRRKSESLCEQEDLEEGKKQEVQQSVRETEEQWKTALKTAEDNLNKAETQAQLDKDLDAVKAQNENIQSWIKEQEQNVQSLGGCIQVGEKLQIAQVTLNSKPEGDSKLQDLKQKCQSLCDNPGLDESKRREVQDAVRQTEEQWRKVLQAAEEGLNKAKTEASTEKDFDSFKTQSEGVQSWIKEQKQKLLPLSSHMPFEERLQVAQAVISSKPEGDSKVLDLKTHGESLCKHLEGSKKPEVQQVIKDTEQQWGTVLQAARQAELRSLSDDFDAQSKNTQSWIRDKQQQLQSLGSHTPPDERCHTAQAILSSKPDGDCMVNNLRRRGQTLCDHQDADKGRKAHVQKTIRDTEEQWKTVLQAAKQVEAAAEVEMTMKTEQAKLKLKEFDTQQQDTHCWLTDFQQRLDLLKSQTTAEDKLHTAKAIMSSKPEGDSRIQKLRRRGQSLSGQDLEEPKKQEVQQKVKGAEEQWTRVLQNAKEALDQAEKQFALEGQLKEYEALKENTKSWLEDKQQSLVSLDSQTDPEKIISTAQTILSCKPEGDSKLTELRRQSQSLSDQEDLEEDKRQEAQQTVKDSEEQWKTVLQKAENTLKKAEVQYSLSRELESFHTQAGNTKTWVKELQEQAKSKGSGTQGSRAQIEDRLNTAQVILSSKSNGEAQVMELKKRAKSLCDQKDLEKDKRQEVQQTVKDTEQQWKTVLRAAEETQRQLKGVVERMASCQNQREQTEASLSDLQKQTSNLPRVFPWPGLGERRQAVENARSLLDQSTALAPVLSDVRTQAAELFKTTQDPGWSDPSWAAKEEAIPALLKELTEAAVNLEQGILMERQCTQLVEQHEAAQDWLREQVKGLGAPPADRQGLHNTVNTLKALLQTVDRENKEMKELDSARDSLLNLCTPGGRDALTLEVSQLHDLCATSEREVKERLKTCETRLEELDGQLAKRAKGLKERAAALQWELRSLDQALSYSEPHNNITQLQQHWHSLQNCEKSLEDLGVKVHDLNQEVKATPATDELPAEITTVVQSLCQQHDSLKSRLSDRKSTCTANTARCLMDSLHALQEWNLSRPPESSSSVKVTLEEGEKLQANLQEALSRKQFLTDCLMPVLIEKLEREGSETLREADTHKASLSQSLKEPDGKSKQKLSDVPHGNGEETKASLVAPPRKSKRSPEKKPQVTQQKNITLTETSTSIEDVLSVSVQLQTEAKTSKPTVTVVMEDTKITGPDVFFSSTGGHRTN